MSESSPGRAAYDELRRELMPINTKYPLADVIGISDGPASGGAHQGHGLGHGIRLT